MRNSNTFACFTVGPDGRDLFLGTVVTSPLSVDPWVLAIARWPEAIGGGLLVRAVQPGDAHWQSVPDVSGPSRDSSAWLAEACRAVGLTD